MTEVYGVYADCHSLADLQARRDWELSMLKQKMHALSVYQHSYKVYPFALEDMVGTEWVNSHTFCWVKIDEIINYDLHSFKKRLNAYYNDGQDCITIYREIQGEVVPCVEHWIRVDDMPPVLRLEFKLAEWDYMEKRSRSPQKYIREYRLMELENLWNEINWFAHLNHLPAPKKPVLSGEQIPLF